MWVSTWFKMIKYGYRLVQAWATYGPRAASNSCTACQALRGKIIWINMCRPYAC